MPIYRGGWPHSYPPNQDFELNQDSPQAKGLVMWLPMGVNRQTGQSHIDRVRGMRFTESGTPEWVTDGERGFSLEFDDGSSEYLENGNAVVSAAPYTYAALVNSDNAGVNQTVLGVGIGGGFQYSRLYLHGTAPGDPVRFQVTDGGGGTITSTTTGYSANTWHHIAAVAAAADDRAVFIDGGSKGTSAVARAPAGLDTTRIGTHPALLTDYMSGRISDARIYNRALSDAEVYNLYSKPWDLYKPVQRTWAGWAEAEEEAKAFRVRRYKDSLGLNVISHTDSLQNKLVREFDDGSSEYLQNASAVATTTPLTMACWFNSDSAAVNQTLLWLGDTAGFQDEFTLWIGAALDKVFAAARHAGPGVYAFSATGYSVSTWHHACAVYTNATSRAAFIDGGGKGTNTTSQVPAGIDATAIGRTGSSKPVTYTSGRIAHAAIYNSALSDAEVWALAHGAIPLDIRRQNLVAYWPLTKEYGDRDIVGQYDMTAYNTPSWGLGPQKIKPRAIPHWAGLAAAGGAAYELAAILAGVATTPSAAVAVGREIDAIVAGTTLTPSSTLSVSRELQAILAGATSTPSVSLATAIEMLAALAGQATTPSAAVNVAREMDASLGGVAATPSASVAVDREMDAVLAGATTTPSAELVMAVEMVAALGGVTTTPSAALAVARGMAAILAGTTVTPSAAIAVARTMAAVMAGEALTPDDVVLSITGIVEFAAVCAGVTVTPSVSAAIAREVSAVLAGTVTTPSAALVAARTIAAECAGTTTTPSTALAVLRELTAVLAGVTATPSVTLSIAGQIELLATILGQTVTPSASMAVAREMAAVLAGTTVTPSAVLDLIIALSAIVAGTTTTPSIDMAVARQLSAILAGEAATPAATLAVSRELAAILAAQSTTPTNAELVTALIAGLIDVAWSSKAPATTFTSKAPSVAFTIGG